MTCTEARPWHRETMEPSREQWRLSGPVTGTKRNRQIARPDPRQTSEAWVAERAFYEKLGLPVIYEGPEYPEFIGFGTETVHFGIQKAAADNDPPSVLTWQIGVTDVDSATQRCRSEGISFDLEHNNPAPGWTYRRLLIRTPSGYRLALEGPNE
jgi:hypothetical protein